MDLVFGEKRENRGINLGMMTVILRRLMDEIIAQGVDLLAARGVTIDTKQVSIVMALHVFGAQSTSELSKRLVISHQLTTQRLDQLEKLGFVTSKRDPGDQRKRLVTLTRIGKTEAKRVASVMELVAAEFEKIFKENGVRLFDEVLRFEEALKSRPLAGRIASKKNKKEK